MEDHKEYHEQLECKIKEDSMQIDSLKKTYKELKDKQVEIFKRKLSQIKPNLNFIKNGKYFFTHPEIKYRALDGPIVGMNKEKNLLYVYSLDRNFVEEINLYNNNDKKDIPLWYFIKEHDFDIAMKGLISLENITDEIIRSYQNAIDDSQTLISKYEANEI